ncbi:MAG: hypothetical protein CM15mP3_05010 [Candidatus Poseidoniales archaeon]|nr:MAG: hypothetical protein CM15mP3_05010 [Candidatus Poseidoniales archaeon]
MMLNMWMEWLSLTESIWMGALAAVATLGALGLPARIFTKGVDVAQAWSGNDGYAGRTQYWDSLAMILAVS